MRLFKHFCLETIKIFYLQFFEFKFCSSSEWNNSSDEKNVKRSFCQRRVDSWPYLCKRFYFSLIRNIYKVFYSQLVTVSHS
jgi:hypothetical protein